MDPISKILTNCIEAQYEQLKFVQAGVSLSNEDESGVLSMTESDLLKMIRKLEADLEDHKVRGAEKLK
jgi:hypothetical protein